MSRLFVNIKGAPRAAGRLSLGRVAVGFFAAALAVAAAVVPAPEAQAARIKDIAFIEGVRPNQLVGYGLVVGLNGTGDKSSAVYTTQSVANMLNRLGMKVDPKDVKVKNTAAVIVTAELPAFAKAGTKLDVIVSSLGDSTSLQGGTLIATPLKAHDGGVYAAAQGPLTLAGFSAGGDGKSAGVTKNHMTVGKITGGAVIEKEVPLSIADKGELSILLRDPDFTTAERVAAAINAGMGAGVARPVDAARINVAVADSQKGSVVAYISKIEAMDVRPDAVTRVVVNERTGTVVIGENVRISTVAVSHGDLTVEVKTNYLVSQPAPFSQKGDTVVQPLDSVDVKEEKARLVVLSENVTLGELVKALNLVGVTPRDLVAILQAIKAAGALQAEIEVI